MPSSKLIDQTCKDKTVALKEDAIKKLLKSVKGWKRSGDEIRRAFEFKDFYQTMAFVNAVAYIANQQNHHPDMEVGYNKLAIRFSTHSVGGLSMNDFICAAKIDGLD
ncbi:MAG TPA: 4a-hydroxytetrahydrobiopterin dehydratase, partial [Tepidisphaeraceae bacterium]|jgi:4a-hydroxytetrahydrobiopterin dehydratase|nr:4a-hydroxytetrahydrobiopterin dehydratase [Tepidisphaeraceae bacterium]